MKNKKFLMALFPAVLLVSCASLFGGSDNSELTVAVKPEYFSPDGDGKDDTLTVTLGVQGSVRDILGDSVAGWNFDILWPVEFTNMAGQTFKHFEGQGYPSQNIVWDGNSDPIEMPRRPGSDQNAPPVTRPVPVQSMADYPYRYTLLDAAGKVLATRDGIISVDVMVFKQDDGRLRIQVLSIIFPPNSASFDGLDERMLKNNDRVIKGLAASLKRLSGQITIEGHANPENAPGTKAREDEEKYESRNGSLSEQRAQKVLDLLAGAGVDRNRMNAQGKGISRPVFEFNGRLNWANRRVEFYLDK